MMEVACGRRGWERETGLRRWLRKGREGRWVRKLAVEFMSLGWSSGERQRHRAP